MTSEPQAPTATTGGPASPPDAGGASTIPVIVHLSGPRRGTTQRLQGDALRIGAAREVEIRVSPEPSVAGHHATLVRRGDGYEIHAEPEQPLWVNGETTDRRFLVSGAVLEIGRDGPVLRYRLYPAGSRAWKSVGEAFSDSLDAARLGTRSTTRQAGALIAGALKELATQTSIWFRVLFLLVAVLLASTLFLARRSARLEASLARESTRVEGIAELLETGRRQAPTPDQLERLRAELETTAERIAALEERSDATATVVAAASRSVVFLQGAYGFSDPESGEPLRLQRTVGGDRLSPGGPGEPFVGVGGDGPILEAFFSGTAFVAEGGGLLLTNRHVALPWEYDRAAKLVASQGFRPRMHRLLGYLPGESAAFEIQLLVADEEADLAVLACVSCTDHAPPLTLRIATGRPGEGVVVLGYPAGIPALLARADEDLVAEIMQDEATDFWTVVERLAEHGHIGPLASFGIVAQVNPTAVVYDAETTRGGSGGPVLDLEGQVLAVTSAVVTDFGGSNIGVPATRAGSLLALAAVQRLEKPTAED